MTNIIMGIFSSLERAENAIFELETLGYNPKEMPLTVKDDTETGRIAGETGAASVIRSAVEGTATGVVLGGIAGLVASYVLPELGAFFIGEQIATALGLSGTAAVITSGAATGGLAGAVLGTLNSILGLSNEDVRTFETKVRYGGILIAVPVRKDQEAEVEKIMTAFDAENIKVIPIPEQNIRPRERDFRYPVAHFSEVRKYKKST